MKRSGLFKNTLWFLCVFLSFYFALSGRAATYFLCFAHAKRACGEKVSKERRPRLQVWLRQTSLTAHAFGGARVSLRSGSPLFPPKQAQRSFCEAKTMFRSAAPRGGLHGLGVSGSLNKIVCKWPHFNWHLCVTSLNSLPMDCRIHFDSNGLALSGSL